MAGKFKYVKKFLNFYGKGKHKYSYKGKSVTRSSALRAERAIAKAELPRYKQFKKGQTVRDKQGQVHKVRSQSENQVFVETPGFSNRWIHPSNLTKINKPAVRASQARKSTPHEQAIGTAKRARKVMQKFTRR